MRIKLDLTSFLGDHRKNSMLLIDPKEQKTVRDVVNRIITLFRIDNVGEEGFALFSDDFYLHHDQSSHLLEGCDTLRLSRCSEDEAQAKQKKEKKKRKRKKDGGEEEESLDQTVQSKKKRNTSGEEVEGKLEETVLTRRKRKKKEPCNKEVEEDEEEIFISKHTNKRDQKGECKGHGLTKKRKRETYEEEEEEEIVLVKEASAQQISLEKEINKKKLANVEPPANRSSSSGEESSVKSLKIFTASSGLSSKGSSEKLHSSRVYSLTKNLSLKKDHTLKAGVPVPTQSTIPAKSQTLMKSQISSTKVQSPAKESAKKVEATTSEEANVSAVFQADCSEDPISNQQSVHHSSQDSSSDEAMKVSGSESKNKRRRKRKHRKKPVRATSDDFINSSTKDEVPPSVLVEQQTASSSHSMQHHNFTYQKLRGQIPGSERNSHGRIHIVFDQDDDECQIESSKPSIGEGQNMDDQGLKKNIRQRSFWDVKASKVEEFVENKQSNAKASSKASASFGHSTPKFKVHSQPPDMDEISEISISSDCRTQPGFVKRNQETPSPSSNFSNILGLMDQDSQTTPTVCKRQSLKKVDDEVLIERTNQKVPMHQTLSAPPNPIPRLDTPMNESNASIFHNIMAIENRKVPLIFHHQSTPTGGSFTHGGPEVPTSTVVSKSETVLTKVTKSVVGLTKVDSVVENVTKSDKLFASYRKLPGVTSCHASAIEDLRTSTYSPSAVSVGRVSSQLSTDSMKSQSSPSSSTTSPSASNRNIQLATIMSESSPREGKNNDSEVSQVEVNLCEEGEAHAGDTLKNSSEVQDKCLPLEEAPGPGNVQEKEIKSCLPQPSSCVSKEEREDQVCQSGDAMEEETPVVDIVSDSEGKSPVHPKNLPYEDALPSEEAYKRFPLVETLPKKGEYLAVKILKLDENYSPIFSGYLRVEVLKVDGINVTLKYLDKDKSPSRKVTSTNEVVDLTFEEDDFYIEQVDWRNIEAPRLLFP